MLRECSLLILLSICWTAQSQNVSVKLAQGTIQGYHLDQGPKRNSSLYYGAADLFLGVPYVKPPLGALRFQKPQKLDDSNNTYFTNEHRKKCPQAGVSNDSMDEDCLYLNIFTPDTKAATKYPVMIYIHGGGLTSGSASDYSYKGGIRNYVTRDVVVVTIQYRLAMLGFFTTYTDDFPANLGMLDQFEAIRWVTENIENFGGDRKRITLVGHSAGAASVSAHTLSPLSQNLFQAAVMQSAVASTVFDMGVTDTSKLRAQQICHTSDDEWNSKNYTNLKNCLMNVDYHVLLDGSAWTMSVDNNFLPNIPQVLAKDRPKIPIMIGSVLNEQSYFELKALDDGAINMTFFTKQSFEAMFLSSYNYLGSETHNEMLMAEKIYSPAAGIADDDNVGWMKIVDKVFSCMSITGYIAQDVIDMLKYNNTNVFLYQFVYPTKVGKHRLDIPGFDPVPHTAELPFLWIFEDQWQKAIADNKTTQIDFDMIDWFAETWSTFVKTGSPKTNNDWPALTDADNLRYYEIGGDNFRLLDQYRIVDQTYFNGVGAWWVIEVLSGPLPPPPNDGPMTTPSTIGSTTSFASQTTALTSILIAFIIFVQIR